MFQLIFSNYNHNLTLVHVFYDRAGNPLEAYPAPDPTGDCKLPVIPRGRNTSFEIFTGDGWVEMYELNIGGDWHNITQPDERNTSAWFTHDFVVSAFSRFLSHFYHLIIYAYSST